MSRIPLEYHTNVLFYTKYTHPTLICRGTDGRMDGRTEIFTQYSGISSYSQGSMYKKSIRFAVEFFLSYELLNSRKRRTFYTTSYLQGQLKYVKAKEAIEFARAGLLPQEESVRKLRKEKKKTKEGKKVAPAKARFHVS